MGAVVSGVIDKLDNSKAEEAKTREQLDLMMKLANARLDTFEARLNNMFLDRDAAMKTSVPGKRALRFERSIRVDAGKEASLQPIRIASDICLAQTGKRPWSYIHTS